MAQVKPQGAPRVLFAMTDVEAYRRNWKIPTSVEAIQIDPRAIQPHYAEALVPAGTGQTALRLTITAYPGAGGDEVVDGGFLVQLLDPLGSLVWEAQLVAQRQ